ncbi:MAG: hypothetical protein H7268_15670 [Sandarakinorhabdus sp.]|nr:hypothetical protein [Sandarakinorhabdus sp.]
MTRSPQGRNRKHRNAPARIPGGLSLLRLGSSCCGAPAGTDLPLAGSSPRQGSTSQEKHHDEQDIDVGGTGRRHDERGGSRCSQEVKRQRSTRKDAAVERAAVDGQRRHDATSPAADGVDAAATRVAARACANGGPDATSGTADERSSDARHATRSALRALKNLEEIDFGRHSELPSVFVRLRLRLPCR